ncbi:apolipoprotein A [Acrasis kona]|uniref:Apolipoprotein A n=1 Tax=Acrasis kona TaxID=1008807 RepID=A0AAW2Z871_9EUKA
MTMGCFMNHRVFTVEEVERIKSQVRQDCQDLHGRVISTNDILSAHYWKVMAEVNDHVSPESDATIRLTNDHLFRLS